MKRLFATIILLSTVIILTTGCMLNTDMPFNGDVVFHEIGVTVPNSFIRDSTQSTDDGWLFEKGNYSQMIIIVRNHIDGDVSSALDDYLQYMTEQGCDSARTTFKGMDAIHTTYTQNGMFCQEMLFAYNSSFYAVALRGGTVEEFQSLIDTIYIVTPDTPEDKA